MSECMAVCDVGGIGAKEGGSLGSADHNASFLKTGCVTVGFDIKTCTLKYKRR